MNDKIKSAFDDIVADEALKARTEAFIKGRAELRKKRPRFSGKRLAGALAAMILIIGAVGGYSVYAAPVSYIDIEVNPSVELALNRFDRVVGAEGINDDGKMIIAPLALKHMTYTDAVDAILASAAEYGYLDNSAEVVLTVTSEDEQALESGIRNCDGFNRYNCRFGTTEGGGHGVTGGGQHGEDSPQKDGNGGENGYRGGKG